MADDNDENGGMIVLCDYDICHGIEAAACLSCQESGLGCCPCYTIYFILNIFLYIFYLPFYWERSEISWKILRTKNAKYIVLLLFLLYHEKGFVVTMMAVVHNIPVMNSAAAAMNQREFNQVETLTLLFH